MRLFSFFSAFLCSLLARENKKDVTEFSSHSNHPPASIQMHPERHGRTSKAEHFVATREGWRFCDRNGRKIKIN